MSSPTRPTREQANEILVRLAELATSAEEQVTRLRLLAAHCDQVGIEKVEWHYLLEMAVRTEMLRRLQADMDAGHALLGIDPQKLSVQ